VGKADYVALMTKPLEKLFMELKYKRSMRVCGKDLEVRGRLIRIARLEGDGYLFPEDPNAVVDALRRSRNRIDLVTFLQRLPGNGA
jgi:hypothetical protein